MDNTAILCDIEMIHLNISLFDFYSQHQSILFEKKNQILIDLQKSQGPKDLVYEMLFGEHEKLLNYIGLLLVVKWMVKGLFLMCLLKDRILHPANGKITVLENPDPRA